MQEKQGQAQGSAIGSRKGAPAQIEAVDEGDALRESRSTEECVRQVRRLSSDRSIQVGSRVEAASGCITMASRRNIINGCFDVRACRIDAVRLASWAGSNSPGSQTTAFFDL